MRKTNQTPAAVPLSGRSSPISPNIDPPGMDANAIAAPNGAAAPAPNNPFPAPNNQFPEPTQKATSKDSAGTVSTQSPGDAVGDSPGDVPKNAVTDPFGG